MAYFDYFKLNRSRPFLGFIDPEGHNDHWHFDLFVGERRSGAGPYVWMVDDKNLFARLTKLGSDRNSDLDFWSKFAGLSIVPTKDTDFPQSAGGDAWKQWWKQQKFDPTSRTYANVSMLPVWYSSTTKDGPTRESVLKITKGHDECWGEQKGDFPGIYDEKGNQFG